MIKHLLHALWVVIVSTCMATIITEMVLIFALITKWKIDGPKVIRAMAALQGLEISKPKEVGPKGDESGYEQPSYDEILNTRALKFRNLELREQELRNGLAKLQNQEGKLSDEQKHYKQVYNEFDQKLTTLSEGVLTKGQDEVRQALENIKPKQAKELISEMLDRKETDEVVRLLSGMPPSKQAKIISEFIKLPADKEKISEVLRRIREGEPATSTSDTARKELEQKPTQAK
jgi:hypothetical protein